jgi:hypothetical protein
MSQELDLIYHACSRFDRANPENTAQLFTHREALLLGQEHPGMRSAGIDPFRVKSIEVADVERIENATSFRGKGRLLRVGFPNQIGV